jgi:carbamoyl-phosphate synthase large subunit
MTTEIIISLRIDFMEKQNTLILSAGRRVELVRSFLEQRTALGHPGRIYSTDLNPQIAPACHVADGAFSCPRATEDNYINYLISLCKDQNIGLVVPTIDTELLPLAYSREFFVREGIHVSIPDVSFVEQCRDKRQTGKLFNAMNLRYPQIFELDSIKFPAFAKPVSGSSSKGIMILHSESDVQVAMTADSNAMICEYIGSPFVEYTIDAYFDFKGELVCIVPRLRIETRAGEVSKGVTRKNRVYDQLITATGKLNGCRGCITIQVFYNPETHEVIGLEINPRFGGGFPLSYSAGANFPGWLMNEAFLAQRQSFFDSWRPDLMMLRYDSAVWIENAE